MTFCLLIPFQIPIVMTKYINHIARNEKRHSKIRMFVLVLLIGLTSVQFTSASSIKETKETTEVAECKQEFLSRRIDLKIHPTQSRNYKITTRLNINTSYKAHYVTGMVTGNKSRLYILFQQLIH